MTQNMREYSRFLRTFTASSRTIFDLKPLHCINSFLSSHFSFFCRRRRLQVSKICTIVIDAVFASIAAICCYFKLDSIAVVGIVDVIVCVCVRVCDAGVCYDYYYFCYDYLSSICGNNKVRLSLSLLGFRLFSVVSLFRRIAFDSFSYFSIDTQTLAYTHTFARRLSFSPDDIRCRIEFYIYVGFWNRSHQFVFIMPIAKVLQCIRKKGPFLFFFCTCTFVFSVGAKNTHTHTHTHSHPRMYGMVVSISKIHIT